MFDTHCSFWLGPLSCSRYSCECERLLTVQVHYKYSTVQLHYKYCTVQVQYQARIQSRINAYKLPPRPPFFLPLFCTSIGLTSTSSSLIIAGFNLASACGRICFGFAADGYLGRINSMLLCLSMNAISTLAIWPFANGIGPL